MQAEHPTGGHQNVPPSTASPETNPDRYPRRPHCFSQGFHQFWQQKRILFVFKTQTAPLLSGPAEVAACVRLGKDTPVWDFQPQSGLTLQGGVFVF